MELIRQTNLHQMCCLHCIFLAMWCLRLDEMRDASRCYLSRENVNLFATEMHNNRSADPRSDLRAVSGKQGSSEIDTLRLQQRHFNH